MAKNIRIKRGLDNQRLNYTPLLGELVFCTDTEDLWVGDGVTVGGIKITANVEMNYIPLSQKGQSGGVATLDATGKVPSNQIPSIAISETYVVANQTEQLDLPAELGDVAIRTDEARSWINSSGLNNSMADWTEIVTPGGGGIQTVNGQTGPYVSLSLNDLTFVDLTGSNPTDLLQMNASGVWGPVPISEVGVTTFVELSDTADTLLGQDGKFAVVDEAQGKIIFTDSIDGGTYAG